MAGDFRFSYLLIKYRKVSGSDDNRKFASTAVAKTLKSLATPDFFGTPTAAQKHISKRISKTIEYLMISVERQFHKWRGIEAVITRRS